MSIEPPFLLFLGDASDPLSAKTAFGLYHWRPNDCLGQYRLPGCKITLGLPDRTPLEAKLLGASTLVLGLANSGGVLSDKWVPAIVEAIEAGLDIASGLHQELNSVDTIREAAAKYNRILHDVRRPSRFFSTGKGAWRDGKRLLTVGTDCSIGKNYTALAIEREMKGRGFDVDYRATGQTGILISGNGVPLDAVPVDFVSGAAEWLSPEADDNHWDVIEGQASLFNPSYAGLTLGLIHGSQPDAFVVCHEPGRKTMRGVDYPLPSLENVISEVTKVGQLTNPRTTCIGLSINASKMSDPRARSYLDRLAREFRIPAVDPMRFGCEEIVDQIESCFPKRKAP